MPPTDFHSPPRQRNYLGPGDFSRNLLWLDAHMRVLSLGAQRVTLMHSVSRCAHGSIFCFRYKRGALGPRSRNLHNTLLISESRCNIFKLISCFACDVGSRDALPVQYEAQSRNSSSSLQRTRVAYENPHYR